MLLIKNALPEIPARRTRVPLKVDRHKLARRRWRGTAADGTDFGFDVEVSLAHGDCIHCTDTKVYVLEQLPEACYQIPLGDACSAAWIGWMIGNLHFKAAFSDDGVLVPDDPAVRQMLDREQIHYHPVSCVFEPNKQGGHSHDHDHEHGHVHAH